MMAVNRNWKHRYTQIRACASTQVCAHTHTYTHTQTHIHTHTHAHTHTHPLKKAPLPWNQRYSAVHISYMHGCAAITVHVGCEPLFIHQQHTPSSKPRCRPYTEHYIILCALRTSIHTKNNIIFVNLWENLQKWLQKNLSTFSSVVDKKVSNSKKEKNKSKINK